MTKEELRGYVHTLAELLGGGELFEPQALQFLTVRGLTLEEARAALVLDEEEGTLVRGFGSHYRRA